MITTEMLTPMLRMPNAEIDMLLNFGLNRQERRCARNKREYWREETRYEVYVDDWEREGDDMA
ncbi:MAG: hypothetical protein IJ587_05145 [Synergistaceae bacterium]|nr:hypothetical protein [Synergistaceae bacterium]